MSRAEPWYSLDLASASTWRLPPGPGDGTGTGASRRVGITRLQDGSQPGQAGKGQRAELGAAAHPGLARGHDRGGGQGSRVSTTETGHQEGPGPATGCGCHAQDGQAAPPQSSSEAHAAGWGRGWQRGWGWGGASSPWGWPCPAPPLGEHLPTSDPAPPCLSFPSCPFFAEAEGSPGAGPCCAVPSPHRRHAGAPRPLPHQPRRLSPSPQPLRTSTPSIPAGRRRRRRREPAPAARASAGRAVCSFTCERTRHTRGCTRGLQARARLTRA